MIVTRTFNWNDGSSDENGMSGWLPAWFNAKNYEPSGGQGVAHDMLEHRRSDTGKWHQELMAFGAILHVRVVGGDHNIRMVGADCLGEELSRLYQNVENPGVPCLPLSAPRHALSALERANGDCRDNGLASEWISGIVAGVKKAEYFHHEDEPDTYLWGRWITHGYRQARRRLRANPFMLVNTFDEIQRNVDKYEGDGGREYPGCQLVIKAHICRAYVETRLIGEADRGGRQVL